MVLLQYILKGIRRLAISLKIGYSTFVTYMYFKIFKVKFSGIQCNGIPKLSLDGQVEIGRNFRINSSVIANPIGRNFPCQFFIGKKAKLKIGENFRGSSFAIFCKKSIIIGNNVLIGGGTVIYDTDFHSLDPQHRLALKTDRENTQHKEIVIGNSVFIGGHSTILKGVSIGDNAIIAACSVVSRNIPANEIWGGNPAKKIRDIK